MTNPFFIDSDDNPNEPFGVRACSGVGQQKSADCAGQWRTWHDLRIANPRAPFMTFCEFHRVVSGFVTPAVKEIKPKRARRSDLEGIAL